MGHDQPLKALHDDRGERDGALVIWACNLVFLGHRDDGGLLKAGGDYSLGQGQVEYVQEVDRKEDARQLVSTHSEDTTRDANWASGF